tara:strand:+ start:181 stop:507 length:327 start_codon:yes stop_codon:yes gene_type:complete
MFQFIFKKLQSRRFFLKCFFLAFAAITFYVLKKIFGSASNLVGDYSRNVVSLDKDDFELFDKLNTTEGTTEIINSIIEDHRNNRTLFIKSFLYSETEIKMIALMESHR